MATFYEQRALTDEYCDIDSVDYSTYLIKFRSELLNLETNYIIEIVNFHQQKATTHDGIGRYRPL